MIDQLPFATLALRFRELWLRSLPSGVMMDAGPVYDDLVRHYGEVTRTYHSWSHISQCLREFDRVALLLENKEAVELALWFHDVEYTAGASDNERRSAELFARWANPWLCSELVKKVCELILVTMHNRVPANIDESYVLDIDLSSFGLNWFDFMRDTRNVRREQAHIPDHIYYPAHTRFIMKLLNRPRIFHTDFFYMRYEKSARKNIKRLLVDRNANRELFVRHYPVAGQKVKVRRKPAFK
jgi:predicted metal-dependent HD superfamily phosphohydrolase